MLNTYTNYKLITSNLQKTLARTAADPMVARETEYYLKNIGNVKSVDDFLKNQRLYTYAMKAYGLEDMTYAKGFMRKALEGGIEDSKSFANSLTDERYKQFVAAYNFVRYGDQATAQASAKQTAVDNYVRQTLETNVGNDDTGVRLALYFERKAPDIGNAYDILGDKALLQVVQTAFSIPDAAMAGNIDNLAAMIEHRLDIESLKDPKGLTHFLQQFTAKWDLENNTSGDPVLTLFGAGSGASAGISVDMMMSLQRIRTGGK